MLPTDIYRTHFLGLQNFLHFLHFQSHLTAAALLVLSSYRAAVGVYSVEMAVLATCTAESACGAQNFERYGHRTLAVCICLRRVQPTNQLE